jgi:hypothetical protein
LLQIEKQSSRWHFQAIGKSMLMLMMMLMPGAQKQDPRQFVPSTGQTWTTLGEMQGARDKDGVSPKYRNVFEQVAEDSKVIEVYTEPKVSQRFTVRLRVDIWQSGNLGVTLANSSSSHEADIGSLESVKVPG